MIQAPNLQTFMHVLKCIHISKTKKPHKTLGDIFIDIVKAFSSVSHKGMVWCFLSVRGITFDMTPVWLSPHELGLTCILKVSMCVNAYRMCALVSFWGMLSVISVGGTWTILVTWFLGLNPENPYCTNRSSSEP